MNTILFKKLRDDGLISEASFTRIRAVNDIKLFSLHWEITTILYLGVLLLTTGLAILVYKNIDTISHQVILIFIGLVSAAGFIYCFKRKRPYSVSKVESPNIVFDYILLLSCLTFIIFIGYIQYQYHVFGDQYGLATLVPMIVLFFCAYFFDHLGILSLAITNLCAWAGITVTPLEILKANDFNSDTIIITAILLGIGLTIAGLLTKKQQLKPHFAFTYTNFGMHLLFIGIVSALFQFEKVYLLWFIALTAVAFFFYKEAFRLKSFYMALVLTLYEYIGISYVVIRVLFNTLNGELGSVYLACFYFIGSAVALILFLVRMNKKLKSA
ncbi:MAG: DUF2157 domain-containing protein [Bacteroidetes bacterium]|nr:DUF2157 domain-containing protein [Bacteroidota bacterium]